MLKKILILALLLNVPYTRSSDVSAGPRYDYAAISTVVGAACAWFTYKDFQKVWHAAKERDHHLNILNEMGVEVRKVSNFDVNTGLLMSEVSFVIKEHYTMDIPSGFSPDQKQKARGHFDLFLKSDKRMDSEMPVIKSLASLVLLPAGLMELSHLLKVII